MHQKSEAAVKRRFSDSYLMALEYKKALSSYGMLVNDDLKYNTELRLGAAVTSMLFSNIFSRQYKPKQIYDKLKQDGLYPFKAQGWAIKEAKTKKLKMLAIIQYTFKVSAFYRLFYYLLKRIKT